MVSKETIKNLIELVSEKADRELMELYRMMI